MELRPLTSSLTVEDPDTIGASRPSYRNTLRIIESNLVGKIKVREALRKVYLKSQVGLKIRKSLKEDIRIQSRPSARTTAVDPLNPAESFNLTASAFQRKDCAKALCREEQDLLKAVQAQKRAPGYWQSPFAFGQASGKSIETISATKAHHDEALAHSISGLRFTRYRFPANLARGNTKDEKGFLGILKRSNTLSSNDFRRTAAKSFKDANQSNARQRSPFQPQTKSPRGQAFSNRILSPSLHRAAYSTLTLPCTGKPKKALEIRITSPPDSQLVGPSPKTPVPFVTEKELSSKNKFYYLLRKNLDLNPNIAPVVSFFKLFFKDGPDSDKSACEFHTRSFFYELHHKVERTSSQKTMRGRQIITNVPVLLTIVPEKDGAKNLLQELGFQFEASKKLLDCPYFAKIHESFKDNGCHYFVSESVSAQTIAEFKKKHKAAFEVALPKLFYHILTGVALLHSKALVHGNINSKNIIIDADDLPRMAGISSVHNRMYEEYRKNLDVLKRRPRRGQKFGSAFGSANVLSPTEALDPLKARSAKRGAAIASQLYIFPLKETFAYYQYIAPELTSLGKNHCTPKIDVWSLGVLLFYFFYQRLPFKGDNMKAVKEEIVKGRIDFPSVSASSTVVLNELLKAMMKPNPTERASLEEVMDHQWLREARQSFVAPKSKLSRPEKPKLKAGLMMFLQDLGVPSRYIMEKFNADCDGHIKACYEALIFGM